MLRVYFSSSQGKLREICWDEDARSELWFEGDVSTKKHDIEPNTHLSATVTEKELKVYCVTKGGKIPTLWHRQRIGTEWKPRPLTWPANAPPPPPLKASLWLVVTIGRDCPVLKQSRLDSLAIDSFRFWSLYFVRLLDQLLFTRIVLRLHLYSNMMSFRYCASKQLPGSTLQTSASSSRPSWLQDQSISQGYFQIHDHWIQQELSSSRRSTVTNEMHFWMRR